jgi:glycosyltransferase involved in cell wall biosynthesis
MAKVNVLVIPSDRHGVGKYRSIDPHTYLQSKYGEEFHVDIEFEPPMSDEFFKNYQIIHFHSFIHRGRDLQMCADMTVQRIKWCKQQGIKTICDIDDYWLPDQFHPLYHMVKERKDNEFKIKVIREADWITTTTPIFADEIKKRLGCRNVTVLPNAINEEEEQFKPKSEPSDLVRLGWLGGSSHLHDIELLKDGISSVHYGYKGQVQFVLCGFDLRGKVTEIDETGKVLEREIRPTETSWYEYERFFTDDYKILPASYAKYLNEFTQEPYDDAKMPYRRVWTRAINNYAENYNRFDISLAPLKDTLFNCVKSQLKVIESGFHKKPLIASAIGPYTIDIVNAVQKGGIVNSKGNALLVDPNRNHKEWFQHMKRLIASPAMREDLGNALYETVKNKYSMSVVTKTRSEFYKSIV